MKKYSCIFKLNGCAATIMKDVEAENKTDANNIFKDFIKSTLPERLEEYNKQSVKITEEDQ